jgi:hypothetical protein
MEHLADIVICDPIEFDPVIFDCWLNGVKPEAALEARLNGDSATGRRPQASVSTTYDDISSLWKTDAQAIDLLKHEILDHYRNYDVLDHYVRYPQLLGEQTMVQITEEIQEFIISKYYELEDTVVREIVGKKLSKNRKDLDDLSESSGVSLHRVTRCS